MAAALAVCVAASAGLARPVQVFNYDEMWAKSDLVVIAMPVSVRELDERSELPGVRWGNDPIKVSGLETTFDVSVLLKGKIDAALAKSRIVLHHYRLENPKAAEAPNAVQLVTFKPDDRSQYLMFLKRAADGRYGPFNGQTDPVFSIEKLRLTREPDNTPARIPVTESRDGDAGTTLSHIPGFTRFRVGMTEDDMKRVIEAEDLRFSMRERDGEKEWQIWKSGYGEIVVITFRKGTCTRLETLRRGVS